MSSLTSAWKYVGKKGDYMSSKVLSSNHRSRTYVTSAGSWSETGADGGTASYSAPDKYVTDGTNRRTAGSVRCVKDKSTLGSVHMNVFFDYDYYFEGESIGGTVEALANGFNIEGLDLKHAFADSDVWSDLQIEDDGFSLTVPKLEKDNSMVFKLTAGLSGFNEEIDFEKTFITSVYDYYNPDKNHEADNLLDGRFYTFTIKESNLRLTLDNDGKTVIIEEKDFAKESDLYDYMFVIEGLSPTSQHGNYNNKATCKIKHYLSGKYLKRVSDQAGGVQLTENPAEATVFYLCSDWSTENSSFVDILDESGNYLYATDYRNVWFNYYYGGKSYKWEINRIKDPVAKVTLDLDQNRYSSGGAITGIYSESLAGPDDAVLSIQYALSDGFSSPSQSDWKDVQATFNASTFSIGDVSSQYLTDLWIRAKLSWNNTETIYSVADHSLLLPSNTATHTADDIYNNSSRYYVISSIASSLEKFITVSDNSSLVVTSSDMVYDGASVFFIDDFAPIEDGTFTDGSTAYYNVGYGVLKHYDTGLYVKSDLTLTKDKAEAVKLYFCSEWNNQGDNSNVDVLSDEGVFLCWNESRLYFNEGVSSSYKWIFTPVQEPN